MFGFKQKKHGNRKVEPVRNLKERKANKNIKPFLMATLFCMLVVSVVVVNNQLKDKVLFPITDVVLKGNISNVSQTTLKELVLNNLKQGFFNINLNAIAQNIENLNWVAQATLRRVWPNTVEILVREHQAVAVWDENTLLSANGILFKVESITGYEQFVQINGQPEHAKELLSAYSELEQLITSYGLNIKTLQSVDSGEMNVLFNTKLSSIFAMQDKEIQFKRFASLLETGYLAINTEQNTLNKKALKSIDLRYSNGFSVVWQEPQTHLLNKRQKQQAVSRVNGNQHV